MFGSLLMGVALMLVGMFMYLDTAYTPVAVVALVIVYNAAFGFSWVSGNDRMSCLLLIS